MELTERQNEIVKLIALYEPITGEKLAKQLGYSRPALRSDLSMLMMLGMIDAKPKVGYFIGDRQASENRSLESFQFIKVREVQGEPVTIMESTSVKNAVETMFTKNVGSLIVADQHDRLQGIISRKDLLKFTLGNEQAVTMPVSMVMTREPNIVTISPEDSIKMAAEKMMMHEVDSLPVVAVNEQGGYIVIGRITKTTMTRVLLMMYSDSKSSEQTR